MIWLAQYGLLKDIRKLGWEPPLMTSDIREGRGVQDSPQNLAVGKGR